MAIDLLGPLRLDEGAVQLGHRDRVVLSALAMRPGEVVTTEQLADAVWGDEPPASWRKNLQNCVVRLRRALGADAIETTADGGYRLALAADRVDAQQFERTVTRGSELLTLGEFDRAAYTLAQGLALWRGRPLAELDDWEPGRIEAGRLAELRLAAEELWLEATLAAGQHREVLARGQAMVRAAPLREERWRLLALAQYQSGRQSDALRTIQQVRRMLADELGLDPGPELERLEQAVLRQDPALLVDAVATQPSAACPYRGLSPYGLEDAEVFFGREDAVAACTERLHREGVVVVVGPSGSGKSSLVRAGIAAALRASGQTVDVVTPGAHPRDALPQQSGRVPGVLVVDQCEEVFTLCEDEDEREAFLDAVAAHATHSGLVVALRADRMGEFTGHAAFAHLVERGLYLLPSMSEADLRAAIEGPARQSGLVVEPGLVDLLVREVEGEPGALPLLSHVLRETWLRRESRSLTVAGYQACGGIRGAVAQSAEEVYRRTEPSERHVLRDILLRLVAPGADGEPVRARVPLRQVSTDPAASRLVEMLVAARLVTSDDGVYEIAHEALARAWPRLRGWLDDDIEGRRMLHHLTGAADAWDQLDRPDSELYRGARLQRALAWLERADPDLTAAEHDFLAASRQLARDEAASATEVARQQTRMIRRLRLVLAGACVLLALALITGGVAVHQRNLADANAKSAEDAATAALAGRSGAKAVVTDHIDESMLLAVAGVRLEAAPETLNSLLATIEQNPRLFASTPLAGDTAQIDLEVSPDGRTVATLDELRHARLYRLSTGELLAERQVGRPRADTAETDRQLVFSPDGRMIAVAATPVLGPPIVVLDATSLQPLEEQPGGLPRDDWLASDLAFSADSRFLATALRKLPGVRDRPIASTIVDPPEPTAATALVWDLRDRSEPIRRVPLENLEFQSVALSEDGRALYTSHPLTIHRFGGGQRTTKLPINIDMLDLSPDGRFLAGIDDHGLPHILDAADGRVRRGPLGGEGVEYVRFSADSDTLLTVDYDRSTTLWDVGSGEREDQVDLDRGPQLAVDFGPARTLVSAGTDQALRRWDLTGLRQLLTRLPSAASVDEDYGYGAFTVPAPGGHAAVSLGSTPSWHWGAFSLRDLDTGTFSDLVRYGAGYRHTYGAWHPNGRVFATATGPWLRLWNIETAELIGRHRLPGSSITEMDFTPDGSRLMVSELSGRVTMLDARTFEPLGRPITLEDQVSFVSAGPDGHTAVVLTGGPDNNGFWNRNSTGWALLDLATGQVVSDGEVGYPATWIAYSPDGRHAAISVGTDPESFDATGSSGGLAVVDLRTGELVRPPVMAHSAAVWQLAYSPDGTRILTSSFNGQVGLWEAETGLPLVQVNLPEPVPVGAEFLDDGQQARIVTWYTGEAFSWDPSAEHAIEVACAIAGRELTQQEWRDNFGDRPYQRVCDT